jgi:nucleoside-diphosphate-sugar epimerase
MGNKFLDVTNSINYLAVKKIIEPYVALPNKRLVFASSCSIYGDSEGEPKKEFDTLNPLTDYAKSKVAVEKVLQRCDLGNGTTATSLRFATACGMSDRLRLDLVLNDFVASAIINNRIEILSDGSPWRPLIHVKDMSRAIEWAILRDKNISTPYLAVNTGSSSWNYQVSELAKAVANNVSNCEVSVNTQALPDKRSYKVNFDPFGSLAPNHTPVYTLQDTISELIDGISDIRHLISNDFRASYFIRLHILEKHLKNRMLSRDLRWT